MNSISNFRGWMLAPLLLFASINLTSAQQGVPPTADPDPPRDAVVTSLNLISVTFSENVTGVDATDLLINGLPATSVVTNNPNDYTFYFTQPSTGQVAVAFAASHGIMDIDGEPFGGGSWSYTLDPNAVVPDFIISEFLADMGSLSVTNGLFAGAVRDEDGDRPDWIEIFNPTTADFSLAGYYLTDVAGSNKWQFPSHINMTLGAGKYLLVWASGKNRTNDITRLHTNFKIGKSAGGYVGLLNPQKRPVSEFVSYPAQSTDISYGRDRSDRTAVGYFTSPTPGSQNTTRGSGFAPEPVFSVDSGVFTNNTITVTISSAAGGSGTIRYTIDGSEPLSTSLQYSTPLTIGSNLFIKARVFVTGLFPSPIGARTYFFLDSTTKDFNSNLPIIVMSTSGRSIAEGVAPGLPRTKGSVAIFDTFRGKASLRDTPQYQGLADFEIFGQTSSGWPKKPYNIELQDEFGNDKNVPVLGMPAESDWKLRNPWTDKCMMNDFLGYELFEQMGHYSCRRRLVEVFVDTGGGKLSYPADYSGVHCLFEKIKQDKNRVDIKPLTPANNTEPEVTGGYIFKKDKDSPPVVTQPGVNGDLTFTVAGENGFASQILKMHEPKSRDITVNQFNWLTNYLAQFHHSLFANDWLTRTGTNHYSNYIDVDGFVDEQLLVEFTKQIDGYRLSAYYSKDRNGKIKPEPIWDWNLSFGNAYYLQGGLTNGWYWNIQQEGMTSAEHIWLRRLLYGTNNIVGSGGAVATATAVMNSGDPDFIQKVIDRWGVLRTNVFNGDRVLARIDEIAAIMTDGGQFSSPNTPAGRNYAKWGSQLLGVEFWPNPDGGRNGSAPPPTGYTWHVDYVHPNTYAGIIEQMKKWTRGRYLWIDSQFTKAPAFNFADGQLALGSSLTMSNDGGATMYYTLDGTDPRLPGGNVSPSAQTYSGPLAINDNVQVFARSRNGTSQYSWSPPSIGTYYVAVRPLRITEIMYHPANPTGGTFSDDDFEYIELRNISSTNLNIGGYSISGGIDFTFPNMTLSGGQRVLVVANRAAFSALYNTNGLLIAGEYSSVTNPRHLDNDGERLILRGRAQEPILNFQYDDDWYKITDGLGFSLVIRDDGLPASAWGAAASWRPSSALYGSPGRDDPAPPALPQVVINEALTHTEPPAMDAIELANLSGSTADISNWYLSDDRLNPKKFRIPAGTTIPAGGYISFTENQFNAGATAFALSSGGDEVYVFSANAAGDLTGYMHGFSFGAQRNGVTFGRYVTSLGEEHFVSQSANTIGSANSGPLVNNVVISEINYHPPEVFANGGYWNNFEDEFIELFNRGSSPVQLFDPAYPTNTWKLDKAVEFEFPANTSIAAGGYLLVVNFDPVKKPEMLDAFRAKFGIAPSIPVYGPYKGDLNNSGETVALLMPDTPQTNGAVNYVLVEQVAYSDQPPWPMAADGAASLQRRNVSQYANDVANWAAANPTLGGPYTPGAAPVITAHPQNRTVIAADTASVSFSVTASGSGLHYQWLKDGEIMPGKTSSTLVISPVNVPDAGDYQAIVVNSSSYAVSGSAHLTVLVGVRVGQHPQSITTRLGSNITFTVTATSSTPISYQWRKDGINISGATSSNINITPVRYEDRGLYDVMMTDNVGTIVSLPATLVVLMDPVIVQSPLTNFVPQGASVTLSVQVTNTATLPIGFRWRKGGSTTLSNYVNSYIDFLTINNVQGSNNYDVAVYNQSKPGGVLSTRAIVLAIADSDGDGIPDAWESAYGLNPTNSTDATIDSDGDTMSNLAEYIAGTNPRDPLSYLKVESISPQIGAVLTFYAVSNKTYTIQYADTLQPAAWTGLINVPARITNWVATVTDPGGVSGRYYRIQTPTTP